MKYLFALIVSLPISLMGQDILSNYENMVDPLTGDFRWSQGLISIESTSGRSYPISMGYSAEVKTNQPASWIGLGWNLETGEIRRSINGFPDDHKEYLQTDTKYNDGSNGDPIENTEGWGPLYYENFSTGSNHTQDVIFSYFRQSSAPSLTPAFDQFTMSSAIGGGSFKLENYVDKDNHLAFRPYNSTTPDAPAAANNFNFDVFQMDGDPLRNTYIVYYTNAEINTFLGNSSPTDFVEYVDENGNSPTRANNDEIGAFTVIMSDGTRLHYSLPVYQKSSKSIVVEINNAGVLKNGSSDTTRVIETTKDVAIAWKLTAITGLDFRDANTNRKIDDGEIGYWLRFYYAKWFDSKERTPEYDFINNLGAKSNSHAENDIPFQASVSIIERENYYIDRIESDREALVFYKSIRNDEYAAETSGSGKVPALKLSRIVRYYRDGLSITKNNVTAVVSNLLNLNSNTTERNGAYLNEDYNTANNSLALKGVEFSYDYSLQPSYHRNISNYSSSHELSTNKISLAGYTGESIYNIPSSLADTKGKLTLLSVQPYENEFTAIFDDFDFEYAAGTDNPSYGSNDFNATGNYLDVSHRRQQRFDNSLTASSPANYWKLKKIKYPSGSVVEVEYELDNYNYSYNGFNNREHIIPIEAIQLKGMGNGSVDFDKMAMDITLFSSTDKSLLTAKAGRRINFYAHKIIGCTATQTITQVGYNATGIRTYNDQGLVDLNSLQILTNANADQMTIGAPFANVPDGGISGTTDCGSNFNTTSPALFEYAYFTVSDVDNFPGTHRVKSLKVYENSLATDFYALNYAYEKGYATTNLTDVTITNRGTISYGNKNTSFNSIPFSVLYSTSTVTKNGIDGTAFHSSKFSHKLNQPFSFSMYSFNGHEDECYVAPTLLNSSVKGLWEYMHDEDYITGESLPDIVECAIETYIKGSLIGVGNTLTQSDYDNWELISAFIPPGTMRSLSLVRQDGASETLYCTGRGGVGCGSKYIYNNTGNVVGDMPNHYKIYSNSINHHISYVTRVKDVSGQLGQLEKLESFDGKGNLIIETDYEYDVKAYTYNGYKAKAGPNNSNSTSYYTKFSKYYYYPKRKYIFSKGMRYTEEIESLHNTTGIPSTILYADPSKGISKSEKTFLIDGTSISNAKAAAKTQLGTYNISNDLVHERRVFWQDGHNSATEKSNHQYASNTLNALSSSTGKLFGNRLGHRLFNGTTGLDELSDATATVSFDGNIEQKKADNTYSQFTLNTNSQNKFDGIARLSNANQDQTLVSSSQISLINEKLRVLEAHDVINDVYGSTRYSINGEWPLASLANCQFGSFTVSGFEETSTSHTYFEGELRGAINRYEPTVSDIGEAHTGSYVARLDNSSTVVQFTTGTTGVAGHYWSLQDGRNYVTSVWVNNQSYSGTPGLTVSLAGTVSGSAYVQSWTKDISHSDNVDIGDWTLVQIEFTVPEGYTTTYPQGYSGTPSTPGLVISLTGMGSTYCYFDDFRFHPADAALEVNIWDHKNARLSHVLDSQNLFTKLEYDMAGRVIRKIRESIHGVYTAEEFTYND